MKITRKGKPQSERLWTGECNACHSQAEATTKEMTHITDDWKDNCRFSWEKCPVCEAGDKATGYGGMLFYETKFPSFPPNNITPPGY